MVGFVPIASNPLAAWRQLNENPTRLLDTFADSPQVERKLDYFRENAPKVESLDDLMNDRQLLEVTLTAFGLEDDLNAKGRIRAVIEEDWKSPESLANRLREPRYGELARFFKFSDFGLDLFQRDANINQLEQRYLRNAMEKEIGNQLPSLRQAAYFARNIDKADDALGILGDRVIRSVVTETLQLPEQIAVQSVDTQARAIESRLDIDAFQEIDALANLSRREIDNAKADEKTITGNLRIASSAIDRVSGLENNLGDILARYDSLADITDPAGANASDIAVQETAVPELARIFSLQTEAARQLGNVSSGIDRLNNLIQQAGSADAATLADLKTQFSNQVTELKTYLDRAEVTNPVTGNPENLLLDGTGTISVQIDAAGTTVEATGFDLNGLKTTLDNADNSFNAITDSSDTANISAAGNDVSSAGITTQSTSIQLTDDLEAYDEAVDQVDVFAAELNSSDLLRGSLTGDDGLNRLTELEDLLFDVREVAAESAALDPAADRTALEDQFNALRTQIRDVIENPNETGADNILISGDQSYEIRDGKSLTIAGNYNLDVEIADVLDASNLSDVASAESLRDSIGGLVVKTDLAETELTYDSAPLREVFYKFDPRGQIDADLRQAIDDSSNLASDARVYVDSPSSQIAYDGLGRLDQIGQVLNDLAQVAQSSVNRGSTTFRDDLQDEFDTLSARLSDLINETNDPELQNILTDSSIFSEDSNGDSALLTGGYNLDTQLADVVSGFNVDTLSSAEDFLDQVDGLRSQIQSAENGIQENLAQIGDDSVNLLDPDQTDIEVDLLSSFNDPLLRARGSEFQDNVLPNLTQARDLLTTDLAGVQDALQAAGESLSRIRRSLESDARQLNFESAKIAPVLDEVATAESERENNPYKVNSFTKQFIERYLTLAQFNSPQNSFIPQVSGPDAYLVNLVGPAGGIGGGGTGSAAGQALSLLGNSGGGLTGGGGAGGLLNLVT
jgi:hypothetical protein